MIANPGRDAADAGAACGSRVTVLELPLDDSWLRDCGPIYVFDGDGRRAAVHFRFNAWGEKFAPWARDAAVGGLAAAALGDPVREAPIVLEGGSVHGDGAGTLITTEQCLLHPSRNPKLGRDEIEAALREWLAVERIVWLGDGLVEDRDTDGHIDLVAAFTAPGQVLLQTAPAGDPNHEATAENGARLRAAGIDVVQLPWLPRLEMAGEPLAASYMNFYLCNGGVIVPVCGMETDGEALALIGECYPGRDVVGVPGAVLAYGGGGPHCITQQVPATRI
jgi:agmatine deiminase